MFPRSAYQPQFSSFDPAHPRRTMRTVPFSPMHSPAPFLPQVGFPQSFSQNAPQIFSQSLPQGFPQINTQGFPQTNSQGFSQHRGLPRSGPQNSGALQSILDRQRASNRINLRDMYIGDEGARVLASFLLENPSVNTLDLKGNNISASGFRQLFEALYSAPALRSLVLEWNNLGTDLAGLEGIY